jgi:hypothetical protein
MNSQARDPLRRKASTAGQRQSGEGKRAIRRGRDRQAPELSVGEDARRLELIAHERLGKQQRVQR